MDVEGLRSRCLISGPTPNIDDLLDRQRRTAAKLRVTASPRSRTWPKPFKIALLNIYILHNIIYIYYIIFYIYYIYYIILYIYIIIYILYILHNIIYIYYYIYYIYYIILYIYNWTVYIYIIYTNIPLSND